jgi:error-prone DNA polymerase
VGFDNPPMPWSELNRRLSDPVHEKDGGDGPAFSRKRMPYVAPMEYHPGRVPYAELHAHSTYSFLDGASQPEALAEEAARLGLHGLALTDHDGFYGIVRMAEAAEKYPGLQTTFGAELSLGLTKPQNGEADPEGSHLLVLARREAGYHALSELITEAQLAEGAEKGHPVYDLEQVAAAGDLTILTGCRKGTVRQALLRGAEHAAREVDLLVDLFGRDAVVIELLDDGDPLASSHNDALYAIARRRQLRTVATGNVHFASPRQRELASAIAAVRARRSLDDLDGWLPAGSAHLRSGEEMAARFARYPGAIETSVELSNEHSFALRSMKPGLPGQEVPEGHTPMSWLRQLVWEAMPQKYPNASSAVKDRIERELAVIEQKDFPGYFLIVRDIVWFARGQGILCQGRGSAANSAVCYLLSITAVDSIRYGLPFERFLSSMRDEEPDIDVDFDSDRREEVIQYVFAKYGRRNAAQVANVITYRPKFAVRDMAKALGYGPGQQDAWSKQMDGGALELGARAISGPRRDASADDRPGRRSMREPEGSDIPPKVIELANEVLKFPRHLGIHSGGMVLTKRPVGQIVPIEHARMENRTVVQWDKDDCAWMGLVKFDLLGLGMLAALQYSFDLIRESTDDDWTLESMPKEEKGVYDMLCRADSVGVFQVESRAQMGTLPRLQPREFYELVIEIALIRPGPIQGGAVHPYIRRKLKKDPVTYPHPLLEPVLARTMGVPLFQEQLMQMAMVVGNCTAEDADQLRRAMGSKRGVEKISALREKLYTGMAENGIVDAEADSIYDKIEAFANFGFAESHSISFALLVYASSWIKLHYPAAFLASLLRAQPMGFYSPASLTADARRHGVEVLGPDISLSDVHAALEGTLVPSSRDDCLLTEQPPVGLFDAATAEGTEEHRRDRGLAVRLGLAAVRGIGAEVAQRIVDERARGAYRDLGDLSRRVGLSATQLESLASAGAFDGLGLNRREAIWDAGYAALDKADYLPDTFVAVQPPLFPMLNAAEQVVSDLWATGISPNDHPVRHVRPFLDQRGVLSAEALKTAEPDRRVEVGGVVIHRQRPATAGGVTFMNLEDETGMVNVICTVGVWNRYRRVARESAALIIRGILERSPEGVTNLIADAFEELPVAGRTVVRNFH